MEDIAVFLFLVPCFGIYILIGWVITLTDNNLDEDFWYDLAMLFWPIYLFIRIVRWLIYIFSYDDTPNDSYHGGLC